MRVVKKGLRNRRRSQRSSVLLPASVVTMSAYQYLEVVDLSATGAKLHGPLIPDIGKRAMFRLNGFQVLCKVVWANSDLCGIRFDELIPPRVFGQFDKARKTTKMAMLTPDEEPSAAEGTNRIDS